MTVFPCQGCPDLINIAAAAAAGVAARGSHSAVTGAATVALQGSEVILEVIFSSFLPCFSLSTFLLDSNRVSAQPMVIS